MDDVGRTRYGELVTRITSQLPNLLIVNAGQHEGSRPDHIDPSSLQQQRTRARIIADLVPITNQELVAKRIRDFVGTVVPVPLTEHFAAQVIERALLGTNDKENTVEPLPLYQYDKLSSSLQADAAEKEVRPVMDIYQAGDVIVPVPAGKGSVILSEVELVVLNKEHASYLQAQRTNPVLRRQLLLNRTGTAGVVALVTLALMVYTILYQRRVFYRPARALGVVSLLLAVVVSAPGLRNGCSILSMPPRRSQFSLW